MTLRGSQARIARVGRLLLWEGRVSRARLTAEFDLSDTRASEWLQEFRKTFPGWTQWDPKKRAFVATGLAYKRAAEIRRDERVGVWGEMLLPHVGQAQADPAVLSWEFQQPSPLTFSRISLAIADRLQVQMSYRSMAHPEAHLRTLEPHSLLLAGRRWHVRGYCLETSSFRDFVLGRMTQVRILQAPCQHHPLTDEAWNTFVALRLVAHPHLTEAQQRVVREEFFRGTAARVENCRAALLGYLVQDLRASVDHDLQAPPDYQLAVDNFQECSPWLFPN